MTSDARHLRRLSAVLLLLALLGGCVRFASEPGAGTPGAGGPTVTLPPLPTARSTPEPSATVAPTPTPDDGSQVVEVSLLDSLTIEPSRINVEAGKPVRFVITNKGALEHDFFIGSDREQKERESGQGEPGPERYIKVEPGATETLLFTFASEGRTIGGCVVPGHYSAGMRTTIVIRGDD
jgi:uncharacterized cupredoxin-like copper-binding protein